METLFRDFRLAFRSIARRPGFASIVIITLGLGIGANAAVFSVVNAVLLTPLPYPSPEAITSLWFVGTAALGPDEVRHSEATFTYLERENRAFDAVALAEPREVAHTGGERPERVPAAIVTAGIFDVLRVAPELGRALRAEDALPGASPVAVLTYGYWDTRFDADPGVIGTSILIDGIAREIIGVLPPPVRFPTDDAALWLPHVIDPVQPDPLRFLYRAYGRLAPGHTVATATQDVNRLIQQLPDVYPQFFPRRLLNALGITANLHLLRDDVVGGVRDILWILYGTATVLLLIACANVTTLFVVRAETRQRETAVRTALGAGRAQLARIFLAESTLLGLLGGGAGLLLAAVGLRALVGLATDLPRVHEIGMNAPVLGYTLLVALAVGVLFGIAPMIASGRDDIAHTLQSMGRSFTAGAKSLRLRSALVMLQVAMALILLAGSGLMIRSFWALRNVDPGFDTDNLLSFRVALPEHDYPEWDQVAGFYQELLDRIATIPGVAAAGAASNLPLRDGRLFVTWDFEHAPRQEDDVPPSLLIKVATEGYFRAMGIPLVTGRPIDRADHQQRTDAVVVSRAFAERYFPDGEAVGRRMRRNPQSPWLTVAGVVGDVRDRSLQEDPRELTYVPMITIGDRGYRVRTMSIAVRGSVPVATLAGAVREQLWQIDPNIPVADLRTYDVVMADAMASTTFTMLLLSVAGGIALVMGAIGLYGVIAYLVNQRRKEIGIRIALGAKAGAVRGMIARQGLKVTLAGVVVGIGGALALTRLMTSVLYGVGSTDLLTFVAVPLVLLAVAWAAGDVPARRAAKIDPVEALRTE